MNDIKELRAALREKYGARCYRITREGDVHVYGPAPNSSHVCWWLMGSIAHALTWMGLDEPDAAAERDRRLANLDYPDHELVLIRAALAATRCAV